MQILMKIAGFIFIGYGLIVVIVYVFQRNLQYFPATEYISAQQAGLKLVEDIQLKTSDEETLVAWYAPAASGKPTILYFHGNAAGLINRAERMGKYQARGFGFFIAAYRSFAGSTGSPSETALIADAHLAYEYLLSHGVKSENIVVFGESLGTGVAVQLATSIKVGAVILESPYMSAVAMGALRYPYLPVKYLMVDQFKSDQYIGKLKVPVMVVHGGHDQVVPLAMGRQMFDLAPEPKEFILISEAGHNGHDAFGLIDKVVAFITKHLPTKKAL